MGLVAKAFQDIITFSRASSGTYVNSNGYITNSSVLNYLTYSNQPENAAWTKSNSFVQQNLLTYSQEFDNAAWTKTNATITANSTIAPDGTLTADKISEAATTSTHEIWELISASATTYTASNYFKAAERTEAALYFSTLGSTAGAKAVADLSAGTVAVTNFGATTGSTATITNVGNGWYRVTLTVLATAATYYHDTMTSLAGSQSYAGTAGFGIYIWGSQLVQGSVPGDYRATTSAALPVLYADYNGALRARLWIPSASGTTSTVRLLNSISTGIVGAVYTTSVRVKSYGKRWVYLVAPDAATPNYNAWFDLQNGVVGFKGTSVISTSIAPAGNGYYLITVTSIATSINQYSFISATDADNSTTVTADGNGIYIADAQLNDGSSALAYYDTTASAYNAPRFDYDPVTLAAKGLLVEESRANLLLQSNDFQTSWTPTNITRTLNSILSPSGNVDGVKIAATATAATALAQQANVAATSATFSVYVKQGTGATTANTFIIRNVTTLTNLIVGTLNYSTGVFTYTTGSTGVVVTPLANGWWRIALSATAGITSGDLIAGYVGFVGAAATAGDFLYAYQAQLEAGAFATSVIPTVASQVTRAADVASVNTLSPWYNSVAGTLYVEAIANASSPSNQYLATINDGTTNNRVTLFKSTGGAANSRYTAGGVANHPTSLGSSIAGIISKTAITYSTAASGVNIYSNGTAGTAVTAAATPTGMLRLGLGIDETGATALINGHLRRVTYYPRQMTSAEGVALTTL